MMFGHKGDLVMGVEEIKTTGSKHSIRNGITIRLYNRVRTFH